MKCLPTIRTSRLLLRPCSRSDISQLLVLWQDKDMRQYLWADKVITYAEAEETVEESIQWEKEHGLGIWCMLLEAEMKLIGFCGVRFIAGTNDVELLYGLLPTYWRQGFATESSRAMLQYAFENLNVPHVFAGCDPLNTSSFGVMKRLGMHPVPDGTVPVPGAAYYRLYRTQFCL